MKDAYFYTMKKTLFLSILAFMISNHALSWGKEGHQIVARVAKSHLSQPVIDSVQKYLDTLSFDEASYWLDDLRGKKEYDYLKPWHYVNIEKDKTYVKSETPDVISQLEFSIEQLSHKNTLTASEISFYLKVVFHLVGDIHQPLHCGFADDKGGNQIEVSFLGKKNNLHRIWDSSMLEALAIDSEKCIAKTSRYSRKKITKIQSLSVLNWAEESRLLLPKVYLFQNKEIDQTYVNGKEKIIYERLTQAGLRLAGVLNGVFGK